MPFELVFEYSAVVYYVAHLHLPSQNLFFVLDHISPLIFVLEQLLLLCVFLHLVGYETAVAGVVEHFSKFVEEGEVEDHVDHQKEQHGDGQSEEEAL